MILVCLLLVQVLLGRRLASARRPWLEPLLRPLVTRPCSERQSPWWSFFNVTRAHRTAKEAVSDVGNDVNWGPALNEHLIGRHQVAVVNMRLFPQIAKLWGSYFKNLQNNNEFPVRAFEAGCWCWVPVL